MVPDDVVETAVATASAATPTRTRIPAIIITPRPRATPTPATVDQPVLDFEFSPAVPEDERAMIRAGVELTARYLDRLAGVPTAPVIVFAVDNLSSLGAAQKAAGPRGMALPVEVIGRRLSFSTAESYLDGIFINVSSPVWKAMPAVQRLRTTSHEYFHVVQMFLMGPERALRIFSTPGDQERPEGPTWLFEGGAEYISWQLLESTNLGDMGAHLASLPTTPLSDLRELETYIGYVDEEDKATTSLRAVDLLLRQRDGTALVGFYRLLGQGMTWRTAFTAAFGRTIDAFYEEYRLAYG